MQQRSECKSNLGLILIALLLFLFFLSNVPTVAADSYPMDYRRRGCCAGTEQEILTLPLEEHPLPARSKWATSAARAFNGSSSCDRSYQPSHHPSLQSIGLDQPSTTAIFHQPSGGRTIPVLLAQSGGVPHFQTVSPVLGSKVYDSVVKSPRGSNSDVVHSLPYPICSDYTVGYSANQYSKQSYLNQDGNHQKLVTNSYYNHHPQPGVDKYPTPPKDSNSRSNSTKDVVPCDGYNSLDGRFDNKPSNTDLNYCVGQAYPSEKTCDPQAICKKSSASVYNFKSSDSVIEKYPNPKETFPRSSSKDVAAACDTYSAENLLDGRYDNKGVSTNLSYSYAKEKTCDPQGVCKKSSAVYNFKTNELLTQQHSAAVSDNLVKNPNDKVGGKITGDCYPKTKVPNRTTYYQSIVNKSHSRHKSSRRVLPASAYENSKQVLNNYSVTKPELQQGHPNKPVQYSSHHYPSENKKHEYYQPYYHQSSKGFVDTNSSKLSADNTTPAYGNNDYYQKGNVNYSRTGSHQSAISDNYKTPNHSSEHSAYQNKSGSYHSSRTSSDKSGRTYYPIPSEGSYKSYQQDLVPKQSAEEPLGYRVSNDRSSYLNYGNSNSLKSKETVPSSSETPKHIPHDSRIQNTSSLEPTNPSVHPPVSDSSSVYQSNSTRDKPTFYPYAEAPHYSHQRTPPTTKPATAFEPITPSKNTEAFGLLSSSSAISSYPPKPPVSSPVTVSDPSRNSVKTLWSPTITAATLTNTTNREIIAASSRDSHSSHSNSSISSLSQLSQSLGSATQGNTPVQSSKELQREGRSSSSNGHSRSSSGNETPVCSATPVTSAPSTSANSSSASYGISGSLTSLIFSKPSWTSPSVTSVLTNPGSHFTPPASGRLCSPVPSVLPLAPSLPSSHSFAANHPAGGLHSSGPHVMFAPPPLPPAGSLSSPSLPLASASPFGGDSLFAPPPPNQDLLNIRRELDTRFLASQDRSINVPPPPYLRAEMHQHQHQHTHMHQHSPFLPPPLGGSLLPPSAAHLYDKFPKVDSSFYGRNALGLPTYPISPLLAPGSATATPTPFAPPGHMAAFQPKISPLVKAKTMKSGRWCAMHVRISWEIYHHQQQKQQAENQKSGGGPTKTVTDLLRPPNHLFGSIPRPHELGFSSPLLGAAASLHARSPYDVSPQHPSFLGPTPAHLGITPYARPNYPSMGVPGNSFGGLGALGLPAASMLGGRELGPSFLGMGQDPWSRLHRTPPNFPSPSAINATSWGGEGETKRAEQEKREKENEKSKEIARESKKEHEREKQKERDRESRMVHVANTNSEIVRNGEVNERNRDKEWERSRERRETSRSPIRTHKSDGGFEGTSSNNTGSSGSSSHIKSSDIKVKEEKKEDELQHSRDISAADRERTKPIDPDPVSEYMSRGMLPMGLPGTMSHVPPSHFWNPLPPGAAAERYRQNLELHHAREMDREQLMQKYASLSSVMPLLPERYSQAEQLARHLASSDREVERQLQADRDRQVYDRTKLPPPPLRPNDPPYVPPPGLPQTTALFPSLPSPFLNSLCTPGYPPRTKPSSPGGGINNGVPPPLIPCASPVTASTTPSPLHLKMGTTTNSSMENSREHYASKDRRDLPGHSIGEVESQSR
ncbi:autism susceptibility gene 2 protein [Trichonephila inaurata madagascariensis]|uniref:Autism susceptibility gene 2 protein n=1 Tax=Trichonephila inaurata madagascariensis TaxID=2747483 RepID=A0A8X6X6X5_9ARAC|nr:autism susceptibility gene 2 protein [Trichonephila inaurata madagascariensis]